MEMYSHNRRGEEDWRWWNKEAHCSVRNERG